MVNFRQSYVAVTDTQNALWSNGLLKQDHLSACKKKNKKNFFGVYSLKRKTKYLETWFMSVCNHNWWLHPCGATASLIFSFANNISWLFLFCGAFRTESNTSQCVLVMESDDGTKRKKTEKSPVQVVQRWFIRKAFGVFTGIYLTLMLEADLILSHSTNECRKLSVSFPWAMWFRHLWLLINTGIWCVRAQFCFVHVEAENIDCLQTEIAMQIAEVMLKYTGTGVCTRLGNRLLSSNESSSHFSLLKKPKGITALKVSFTRMILK